ncbi:hypothetical protein [Streptomyces sp. RPT161]|uniref:hypothetical protein n=1 Tax=Streptomyces sp. RPT161 TaxID=3015993 RepID=UPI0022B88671|nr:hypothetical protein [Streptomyces sp. RPT161]
MREDHELLARVRELRQRGSGPKQIARALGVSSSRAGALVRQVAQAEQADLAPDRRAVVGCWVNAGWTSGLGMSAAPQWVAADPLGAQDQPGTGGFAQILIARQERASKVTVCGFLVDVYCLGVKNVIGPEVMGSGSVDAHVRTYYSAFDHPPLTIGIQQAQQIVHGAVAYARAVGFGPAPGFDEAATHLGTPPPGLPAISYGREGTPFYIAGPYDDAPAIVRKLEETCGPGQYHYYAQI